MNGLLLYAKEMVAGMNIFWEKQGADQYSHLDAHFQSILSYFHFYKVTLIIQLL